MSGVPKRFAGDDDDAEVRYVPFKATYRQAQPHPSLTVSPVEFAASLLRRIQPHGWRIAVCAARAGSPTRVESGRAWGDSNVARWALFFVADSASHAEILEAVLTFIDARTSPHVLRAIMGELRHNAEPPVRMR